MEAIRVKLWGTHGRIIPEPLLIALRLFGQGVAALASLLLPLAALALR